jgi:hypothetical protein
MHRGQIFGPVVAKGLAQRSQVIISIVETSPSENAHKEKNPHTTRFLFGKSGCMSEKETWAFRLMIPQNRSGGHFQVLARNEKSGV